MIRMNLRRTFRKTRNPRTCRFFCVQINIDPVAVVAVPPDLNIDALGHLDALGLGRSDKRGSRQQCCGCRHGKSDLHHGSGTIVSWMPSSALMKITSPGRVEPSPQGQLPPLETVSDMKAVNWLLPRPGGPPSRTSLPSGMRPGQTQTNFWG